MKDDRLRGAKAIGDFIGEDERRTYYLLETGQIPAGKRGSIWEASKRRLQEDHEARTSGKQNAA